ncbi:MAG TPA: hypothetical protein VFP34_03100 [Microlunatus sp.]|nr:hypothetical protein [Microlunatus sp.]
MARTTSARNTVLRSVHDLGLAAWFGGSLMGAVGLNGAAAGASEPSERLRLAANGWALWAPWQIGAIAAHTVGGVGLIMANRARLEHQSGARVNMLAKSAITIAAAGAAAYAGYLGSQVKAEEDQATIGVTEPAPQASTRLASAQRQLKIIQWAIPALTGLAVILGAQQGEQQRGPVTLLDKIRR